MGPFDRTNDLQNPQQYNSIVPLRHTLRNGTIWNVDIQDQETIPLLKSSDSSHLSLDNNQDLHPEVDGQTVDQGASTDVEGAMMDADLDRADADLDRADVDLDRADADLDRVDADSRYKEVRAAVSREDDPKMACVSL